MKKQYIWNLICILAGNSLYALAIVLFVLPNNLMTGGTTGMALVLNHLFSVPITAFVSAFNFVMFLLGAVILGKKFAITTLISTFYYPFILGIFQSIFGTQIITGDNLLATIFAGAMIGIGIGIVIKSGASTGGMDIPPLVLNKKFHIPVSVSLYVFDCGILLTQILYSNKEKVLYGILLVILYTVILEKVLVIGKAQIQVKIISEHYKEISERISVELDRGCTLLKAETGYMHNDTCIILAVVSSRELPKLNELVQQEDEKAFMIIGQVNEVKGRGFSSNKRYL